MRSACSEEPLGPRKEIPPNIFCKQTSLRRENLTHAQLTSHRVRTLNSSKDPSVFLPASSIYASSVFSVVVCERGGWKHLSISCTCDRVLRCLSCDWIKKNKNLCCVHLNDEKLSDNKSCVFFPTSCCDPVFFFFPKTHSLSISWSHFEKFRESDQI